VNVPVFFIPSGKTNFFLSISILQSAFNFADISLLVIEPNNFPLSPPLAEMVSLTSLRESLIDSACSISFCFLNSCESFFPL